MLYLIRFGYTPEKLMCFLAEPMYDNNTKVTKHL